MSDRIVRVIAAATVAFPVVAGSSPRRASAQAGEPYLPPAVRAYLDAALDSLQRRSRHRATAPWGRIRDSAHVLAAGARTPRETWGALQWAIDRVDRHGDLLVAAPAFAAELLPGRVGYARVPSFGGPPTNAALADSLQSGIRRLQAGGACGWIVDLRWNGGGNVWPMLAGIGPLLGDSLGFAMQTDRGRSVAMYRDGLAFEREAGGADRPYTRATVPVAAPRAAGVPVAVLIDSVTASSAEAVALAFRGRPDVRLFGTASSGLATVNRTVTLADSTRMLVTVGEMLDAVGRPAGARVTPDEVVPMPRQYLPRPSDAVARRAAAWTGGARSCR